METDKLRSCNLLRSALASKHQDLELVGTDHLREADLLGVLSSWIAMDAMMLWRWKRTCESGNCNLTARKKRSTVFAG